MNLVATSSLTEMNELFGCLSSQKEIIQLFSKGPGFVKKGLIFPRWQYKSSLSEKMNILEQ